MAYVHCTYMVLVYGTEINCDTISKSIKRFCRQTIKYLFSVNCIFINNIARSRSETEKFIFAYKKNYLTIASKYLRWLFLHGIKIW